MVLGLRRESPTIEIMTANTHVSTIPREREAVRTVKGEEVVGDGEPGHDERDGVVDGLDVEEEQSNDAVVGLVETSKVSKSVDSGSERSCKSVVVSKGMLDGREMGN
jgi:hypothetical protein